MYNIVKNLEDSCPGEGAGGGGAVEADVPEDQQDLAGAPFLPAMLEQVLCRKLDPASIMLQLIFPQYPHEHDLPAVLQMPPPAPPHQLLLRWRGIDSIK